MAMIRSISDKLLVVKVLNHSSNYLAEAKELARSHNFDENTALGDCTYGDKVYYFTGVSGKCLDKVATLIDKYPYFFSKDKTSDLRKILYTVSTLESKNNYDFWEEHKNLDESILASLLGQFCMEGEN